MTGSTTAGPVAVPQPEATPVASNGTGQVSGTPLVGHGVAPPSLGSVADAELNAAATRGFHKIAAELRENTGDAEPLTVPFGRHRTIRIYSKMSARVLVDLAAAQSRPEVAIEAVRKAIFAADRPIYDEVLELDLDNKDGINGDYLAHFLEALIELYSGVPLDE